MREIVFALQFRGKAGPVPGSESKRQARSVAPSQTLATVLGEDGVRSSVRQMPGEAAVLESRVERFGDGPGLHHVRSALSQDLHQQEPAVEIVLDDEDAQTGE